MDYGDHTVPLPDFYYECVALARKEAIKNDYWYEEFFKIVFEACGVKTK